MRYLILALALAACASAARAEPKMMFGPFPSDAQPVEAMRDNPDWNWRAKRNSRGQVVGAVAGRALPFAGFDWEVTVGDGFGTDLPPDGYSLDLHSWREMRSEGDCVEEVSRLVGLLEPVFGTFGGHPAFDKDSLLYGGFGDFRIHRVGERSRLRDDDGHMTTFAEFDEAGGQSVMIVADYFAPLCSLRLNVFQSKERAGRVRDARVQAGG